MAKPLTDGEFVGEIKIWRVFYEKYVLPNPDAIHVPPFIMNKIDRLIATVDGLKESLEVSDSLLKASREITGERKENW